MLPEIYNNHLTTYLKKSEYLILLIIDNRGIPLYFELLDHTGNSNFDTQKSILSRVLPLLKEYKIVILGDREFCSVELAKWLHGQKQVYYALRLKKSNYIEVEKEIWTRLKDLGLFSGMSLFYQGVKVTKAKGFIGSNIVAKWKRKYRGVNTEEAWFIITNLKSIEETIDAYKKRFGIEEMFRDFKKGGYDLERTKLTGHRLTSVIILITLAYSMATFSGKIIKAKGLAKYVGRVRKNQKMRRRHSNFYIGLHGKDWVESCDLFAVESLALMQLSPGKCDYYRQGLRAISLIKSSL